MTTAEKLYLATARSAFVRDDDFVLAGEIAFGLVAGTCLLDAVPGSRENRRVSRSYFQCSAGSS
jgi:hypothetical protein